MVILEADWQVKQQKSIDCVVESRLRSEFELKPTALQAHESEQSAPKVDMAIDSPVHLEVDTSKPGVVSSQ